MSIKNYMKLASEAYYQGKPILSNEEYDSLESIHGQILGGSGDIPHAYRMYSLKKHYDKDGALPLNKAECVETPKLDGAAVDVFYVDGEFQHMLTRGDGVKGRDITNKAQHLNIPEVINLGDMVQITGEVVARKDVENSRNYASGALNLKDLSEYYQRVTDGEMVFVAYNIQVVQNRWGLGTHYTTDMTKLHDLGFNVITIGSNPIYYTAPDVCVLTKSTPWENKYPTDGIVYRINDNAKFNEQGFTDKFPRGAIAWKEEQEAVQTKLLAVEWDTGKSGKVTPVAILEPVMIGEAMVARATLNNIAYIEALDLELGCTVEVIRSGEIIPKIIGRLYV